MLSTTTAPLTQTTQRVASIDTLRGLVMIVMALDHCRDYLHQGGFFYDATDLTTTTPALFFTRWITHFCAPIFVFLAGMSAYLSGRKKSRPQLSGFLLSRGAWLILLEFTVVNFSLWFDVTFSLLLLQVIWAIGASMVVLAALIFLPRAALLAVGLVILFGHNALDGVSFAKGTPEAFAWALLHQRAFLPITPHFSLLVAYPMLPWLGIMVVGYCFGQLYEPLFDPQRRQRWLLGIGGVAVLCFVLLRLWNAYGDPSPWRQQGDGLFTLLAFLNTTKYPPSLLYSLMMLGPGVLFLACIEGRRSKVLDFLAVYGQVPLFYYVLHFYLIHGLAVLGLLLTGVEWSAINFRNGTGGIPATFGLSLRLTYIAWLLIVLALYPLCRWYRAFKHRQKHAVWSYL